jgi:hypothetical protein
MAHVDEWFIDWIDYHQLLHPHRGWVKASDPDGPDFYAGWIEAFERLGATEDLCRRASRALQANPPKFLNNHLPELKSAIIEMRKTSAIGAASPGERVDPEQVKAAIASHGCPECDGTGWATRRAHWPLFDWMLVVQMFCRCPHGRWRRANDRDVAEGRPRNYDDLQARPELWNQNLSFPSWGNRPSRPDVEMEETTIGQWRYLDPHDPTPEGARVRITADFLRSPGETRQAGRAESSPAF